MPKNLIDLNADMGEGFGAYSMGQDEALLDIVTSANAACGVHAGDATIMRHLVSLCAARPVGLGAHPGFNDIWGFGRRLIEMKAHDLECLIAYQIGALQALAAYGPVRLRHVKAHGALYNMAAKREAYAHALVKAVKSVDASLIVVGLPDSEMEKAAHREGLSLAREGFCDRVYLDDGSLMPRSEPGAVIHDVEKAAAQALRLARDGEVITASGAVLKQRIDTLCIHGDEPAAKDVAKAVRQTLQDAGVTLAPMLSVG